MSEDTRPEAPAIPGVSRESLRHRVAVALYVSMDGCARCKVCDTQIDAAMAVIWPLLEHAQAALAGDNEGVRLWMLDCGELVAKHRARAEAAEAKLARIREVCDQYGWMSHASWKRSILAITGTDEEGN